MLPDVERTEGLPSLELIQDCSTISVTIISRKQPFGSDLECHVLLDLALLRERSRLTRGPSCHH